MTRAPSKPPRCRVVRVDVIKQMRVDLGTVREALARARREIRSHEQLQAAIDKSHVREVEYLRERLRLALEDLAHLRETT